MSESNDVLALVRVSAKKKRLFTPHALRQMSMPHRMITTNEVRKILLKGEIIEDYTDDPRGHSCLMLGFSEENRPIHVVCSPKEDYLAVITAYIPSKNEWEDDYKTRR